jgi:hypothetical protein
VTPLERTETMLGEVLLDLPGLKLERTADRSSTQLVLRVSHLDGLAWLDVRGAQDVARELLNWLVENCHELPELPAMEEDLELEDEDEPVAMETVGQLVVRQDGLRLFIERADEWITCAAELWDQLASPAVTYATVKDDLLTIEDSAGAVVRYGRRRDVVAAAGVLVLERTHWQPARVVHVIPEHTRARSDARWPDCASGFHDRCTSDRCGCPCHARRSVLEQSPER